MKLSLNWLKDFLPAALSLDTIVEALTFSGVELEGIEEKGANLEGIVVARIDSFAPHPNADRLSVCRVSDGTDSVRQIVCGARNFRTGNKVALALPGATLPGGLRIKAAKLRGVDSEGMLCSARELNLSEDSAGLLILPDDTPVGVPLAELFPRDTILEVETTPNRPDLLSHFGIARELAALLNLPEPRLPAIETKVDKAERNTASVRIAATEACSFYTARLLRGVKIGASPAWLRQRLESVGIRPINNAVDVTNYVMLELGQPLHVFDQGKLLGRIRVRYAAPGETLLALDGRRYALEKDDLVIADEQRAIAIAGVMGGEESGVTEPTQDLLLEAAFFDAGSVRRTSRRLGLISDSSFRFERGVDAEMVTVASARATDLLLQVTGGAAAEELMVAGSAPDLSREVEMRPARCFALLGMKVPEAGELLKRLGLRPAGENRWKTPSFRPDLSKEVDLIEEVCRLAGVQNIPSRLIGIATESSGADRLHDYLMQLRRRLVGMGLFEARNLTLVDKRAQEHTLGEEADALRLRNPLAEDHAVLRPSLLSGLLRAAERNFNRGSTGVALFEIGRVFRASAQEESLRLGLIVSGERQSKRWNAPESRFDLFDLKGLLEAAAGMELVLAREEPSRFAPLVCRILNVQGRSLGKIGQVGPGLAKELGTREPILIAEIDLPVDESERKFVYREPDRFPPVTRDIAFVAGKELKYQRVVETVRESREPLLKEVALFDLFVDLTGEKVPVNKKSMACSLTYRASDRTLTQEEVNEVHGRIKSLLVKRLGVVLRE